MRELTVKFQYPRVSPVAQKPEDSGYEIGLLIRLRKDNIGLREVTSPGYSSEQSRSEIRLYRKLTCIHSLSVVMAYDVGEIKTSNVC